MFPKKKVFALPQALKIEYLKGQAFIELKAAARLAGIHPEILERARHLLASEGSECCSFKLATPELLKAANEIEALFRTGLNRVAKVFGSVRFRVKSYRDETRLVFWYETVAKKVKTPKP